jgi:hypothetical protein
MKSAIHPFVMTASLLVLSSMLVAPAHAATPINQLKALDADGSVSIDNVQGRIVVRTWARPEVKIAGSLGQGVEKLVVEGDRRRLRIEVKYPQNSGWGWWGGSGKGRVEPTILEVTVPARADLDLEAVSADVDVQGSQARRLEISSVSGDVAVAGSSLGELHVETVSGNARLLVDTSRAKVDSVSGDIRLEGKISGEVSMESVSGNAGLAAGSLRRMDFSTVSGDANLQLSLADGGSLGAESVSGNVTLVLPANTSARLSMDTFSGSLQSPVGRVVKEEFGPGQSLDARLGSGAGTIRAESFSGDIKLITK